MKARGKQLFKKVSLRGGMIAILILLLVGCATAAKEFDPNIAGPQLIVEPDTIRLGVARMKATPIVFKGKGFQPEDSVFITLREVKKGDDVINVAVAGGDVGKGGDFTAKVSMLVKVSELLRAKIGSNKDLQTIIIVTQPPMPEGTYTVKAVSMESDVVAECKLIVKGPSLIDRLKDWIGGLLG
ncbi:MAG: hypothetical protein GY864_11540, partial [Desulfobacterales bacterium]|nr:hypothetical protein [Desulfobacterales bacterium]